MPKGLVMDVSGRPWIPGLQKFVDAVAQCPRPLAGSMIVTSAHLLTVQQFVEQTLLGGSLPFTMANPLSNTRILVRFAEMPTWTQIGGKLYRLTLSLEILP